MGYPIKAELLAYDSRMVGYEELRFIGMSRTESVSHSPTGAMFIDHQKNMKRAHSVRSAMFIDRQKNRKRAHSVRSAMFIDRQKNRSLRTPSGVPCL